jgi:hypothetical protein
MADLNDKLGRPFGHADRCNHLVMLEVSSFLPGLLGRSGKVGTECGAPLRQLRTEASMDESAWEIQFRRFK